MRKAFSKPSPIFQHYVASKGQLIAAGVLLFGLILISYGYFQQKMGILFTGLFVVVAGVINAVLQLLAGENK
jgi:hypothetical protein